MHTGPIQGLCWLDRVLGAELKKREAFLRGGKAANLSLKHFFFKKKSIACIHHFVLHAWQQRGRPNGSNGIQNSLQDSEKTGKQEMEHRHEGKKKNVLERWEETQRENATYTLVQCLNFLTSIVSHITH